MHNMKKYIDEIQHEPKRSQLKVLQWISRPHWGLKKAQGPLCFWGSRKAFKNGKAIARQIWPDLIPQWLSQKLKCSMWYPYYGQCGGSHLGAYHVAGSTRRS